MKYPVRLILAAATLVVASSAHAATITLFNGNFEGGTNGSPDYDPNDWTVTENTTNNEVYAVAGLNGFTSTLLHFKDRTDTASPSVFQNLSSSNAGLTADTYGAYTLTLDLGWRNDRISGGAATGNATLLFELVNLTDSSVLASDTYTLLQRSTPLFNVYTLDNPALQIALNYDNTSGAIAGNTVGLRISRIDADNTAVNGDSTLWMDNLSITAVPEPSAYGLLGAGALASAAFLRRRRKVA